MNSNQRPDGDAASGDWSVDAFHRGAFQVVQPQKGGHHRAGIDAMLVAACIPDGFAGRVADLGSGPGAAGLAVLSRCANAHCAFFERDPVMLEAAQLTLDHAANAELSARSRLHAADVTASASERREAGLDDNAFDAVIANPPFNDPRDRRSPDSARVGAHVMSDGMLDAWVRTASAILKPSGMVAFIVRPVSLPEVLSVFDKRFGGLGLRFVHPRPGEPAIRMLVTGIKGSRARLQVLAPLTLHAAGSDGTLLPQADALVNGLNGFAG